MKNTLDLTTIPSDAAGRIRPFFEQLIAGNPDLIHSLYVVGSAVSGDYDPARSDVNSLVILKEMNLEFLELLAPLGKTFSKQRVKAPVIMTPGYIRSSLDVFPIEFREMAQIHRTVYGEDLLEGLVIEPGHLRHACERDLKAKLIGLRQGYLSSLGDPKIISEEFSRTISGYAPLFRAILVLYAPGPPPTGYGEVLLKLEAATGIKTDVYRRVLEMKKSKVRLAIGELNRLFEDYYRTTERLSNLVDERMV